MLVMAGCFFAGMGTHEPQKLFWLSFRKQVTLSPWKSAKIIRKLRKLADAQTVRQFAHNAYFPKLRVTTLPPKFARRVSAVHAVQTMKHIDKLWYTSSKYKCTVPIISEYFEHAISSSRLEKCQQEKHRVGDDFGGCLVILGSGKSALFKIGTLSERSEFGPILNAFSRFSLT